MTYEHVSRERRNDSADSTSRLHLIINSNDLFHTKNIFIMLGTPSCGAIQFPGGTAILVRFLKYLLG